jgi:TusA-related sulfurtransferase
MEKGQVMEVLCDYEPAAKTTIPNFCRKKGYPIEIMEEGEKLWRVLIEKSD